MKPLIITATPNICWLHPEVEYPKNPESIAEEAALCKEAGASILHFHYENWGEGINAIRNKNDIILQCGMSSMEIEERMDVFRKRADMISIIASHHDEAFVEADIYKLHPREELKRYMKLCLEYHVKPEFEIWHTGSIWNLNYLIERKLVKAPYITTLFFGWPGGSWTPATVEEYLYRRKYLPHQCVVNVSIMGNNQMDILTTAIMKGDHVRVGTEDYPYNILDKIVTTHELVYEVAKIAKSLGRPIASVQEARQITGLKEGLN